jgi:indole-3-acetate monooxygenase
MLNCATMRTQEGRERNTDMHDRPDYVARARSLGPVLVASADEIERTRELPQSIVSALIDNGVFRLLQPRSLGGAELDPMTYLQVVEQIASLDASTGWCVEQANGCSMVAAFLDREVAQEIFEPRMESSLGARSGRPNCLPSPVGSA